MHSKEQKTELNTIEKRKLTEVIQGELVDAIESYKSKRGVEYTALRKRYDKHPSEKVRALVQAWKELERAKRQYSKQQEREREKKERQFERKIETVEKQVRKLGYRFTRGYSDPLGTITTDEARLAELSRHKRKTEKTVKQLEGLANEYTLKVFIESKGLRETFAGFRRHVAKLTGD